MTGDKSLLLNQNIAFEGYQTTVLNSHKPIMPAEVPPSKKNLGRHNLQLVGNSSFQCRPKLQFNTQHLGLSQMQGRSSSSHKTKDFGGKNQQNKKEKIQEILERINQTCAVQKQQASQLQTLLTDQNQIQQDRHSTGYLSLMASNEQYQRTYSHENKENGNPQIGYLPGLQTSQQQEQQICKNISQWKDVERIQSNNQFHQLSQFQNSYRDITQQHTSQSDQQGNLPNFPNGPNLNVHNQSVLHLYKQIRQAQIQQVQHVIITQEGQRTVQHPHIFAPPAHAPILLPCRISAPPVVAVSSAVTVPLQVNTFSNRMCIVPHKIPAVESQMYLNLPDEYEERFPEHSGSKLNNLLLTTVNAVSGHTDYPDFNFSDYRSQEMPVDILPKEKLVSKQNNFQTQQIQVGLIDSSLDSKPVFSTSPDYVIDLEFSDTFNINDMGESKSRRSLAVDLNSPVRDIPKRHASQDLPQSLPASRVPLQLSKSCSNLNTVSQQLCVNIAESDQTDEFQRGPICQGQVLGENLSHSTPHLQSHYKISKGSANFGVSSPILQQLEFNKAIPDGKLELQSDTICEQKVLPEDSHSVSENILANDGSLAEEVVCITKHDSGITLATKSKDGGDDLESKCNVYLQESQV